MRARLLAVPLLAWSAACAGAGQNQLAGSLPDLSLEQLGNIVVSSVSRREQPLSSAPASVYVISAEDIRRAGSRNLEEALRLAPNLDVARADANQYAISARGFNNTLANKLLVLIDGRTVYTPLFSGTFWEAQDVMLEDIERIEVISGPGAALWGANAVNGVINILTRPAAQTQGGLVALAGGTMQNDAGARVGGKLAGGHYRVYGKSTRRHHSELENGMPLADFGEHVQGGFRADWGQPGDGFTLQGDAYEGEVAGQGREFSGLNVLARWTRALAEGAELRMQAYYDRTQRNHFGIFREELDTYDFELQHALARRGMHRLLWGFGLRHHRDVVQNFPGLAFLPAERTLKRNHLFLQDEIALRSDLDLTLGAKLESNSYTGTEFLPSARLAWRASDAHLVWAAVSRAVRAPSRIDREFFAGPLMGGPHFTSEVSKVVELGYRGQPFPRLSYSVTGFHSVHDGLRSVQPVPGGAVIANDLEGTTKGIEAWGTWRPADWWRLSAGAVLLEQSLENRRGTVNLAPGSEGNDPDGWLKLRASFDLTPAHELDVLLRHYGARPSPEVPAYTALDVRLGWRAAKDAELSLVLQNVLGEDHPEWGPAGNRVELGRAALVKLRLGL